MKLFHSRIIWGQYRKTSEHQELYSRQGENFFILIHLQEREKDKEKFLTPHGATLPAGRRLGDSDFSISCNSPPMLGRVFSKCRTHLWPDGLVVSDYYVVVDPELCEVALALVCITGTNQNNVWRQSTFLLETHSVLLLCISVCSPTRPLPSGRWTVWTFYKSTFNRFQAIFNFHVILGRVPLWYSNRVAKAIEAYSQNRDVFWTNLGEGGRFGTLGF